MENWVTSNKREVTVVSRKHVKELAYSLITGQGNEHCTGIFQYPWRFCFGLPHGYSDAADTRDALKKNIKEHSRNSCAYLCAPKIMAFQGCRHHTECVCSLAWSCQRSSFYLMSLRTPCWWHPHRPSLGGGGGGSEIY